jgi:hypothetical protein
LFLPNRTDAARVRTVCDAPRNGPADLSQVKNRQVLGDTAEPFEKLAGGGDPVPIITIYQGASSSGQELAEAVAGVLGYRCVGRTELVEATRRYGIPEAKLNEIMEKGPPWVGAVAAKHASLPHCSSSSLL